MLIAAAASLAGLLYYFYSPYTDTHFPGCALRSLTGLDCPACGSQRAFADLLHGRIASAVHNNLLFVATVVLLVLWFVVESINVFRGRPSLRVRWPKRTPWILLGVVLAFFFLRNL